MQFNVYKLTCNTTGLVYYGSTRLTLNQRLSKHKSHYKRYIEGTSKKYCTSYEVLKNNNYKTTLLETCFHVPHMVERETYYKEHNKCVNKLTPAVPGRTYKEWREANKEKILKYWKEYNIKNKEKITIKDKKRREKNKEKIAEYKKEWYEKNKEVISERRKEYHKKNKETLAEKIKEKYTCACGSTLTKGGKSRHERTKKHQEFINKKK